MPILGLITSRISALSPRPLIALAALALGACQPDLPDDLPRSQPLLPDPVIVPDDATAALDDLDNAEFRRRLVAFVREVAAGGPTVTCTVPLTAALPLWVAVSAYLDGAEVARGAFIGPDLCEALKEATRRALAVAGPARSRLGEARFVIDLTDRAYALVEHQGEGVELVHGIVPARALDRAMVRRRIDDGAAYLARVLDPERGGVHKFYDAPTDSLDPRLTTIYTASTAYTLLALYALDGDDGLRPPIDRAVEFLLSMQRLAPGQPGDGAFHYALDLESQQPEPRFVVGTTAKTIFTLLSLHALTGEAEHLGAARRGGDWLLTMQRPDGSVRSELRHQPGGAWTATDKESILYTGQVLSALSRLYAVTRDARYGDAAARTAAYLADKIATEGCYLGDDYRTPNPISSSWAILSLLDHARASGDPHSRQLAYDCADQLLARQILDPADVYRHGRWPASQSSSGAGWLAEVFAVLYRDLAEDDIDRRARFRGAIVLLLRQLMQYTYSPENAFVARDPAMAHGGLFWTPRDRYVRTDAVCHAMNAYVFILDELPEGVLVELPEPPLSERLGLDERAWGLARRDVEDLAVEPADSGGPDDEVLD